MTVLYDGWCPMCTRSILWLKRFDVGALVNYASFRDRAVRGRFDLDPVKASQRVQAVDGSGRRREGMDVLVAVALRSVLLWPVVPLLLLARMITGQRLYDALASRRMILVPGRCDAHCAVEGKPPTRIISG
jgi:predicted DCC family thiol-disulfide oxidoreductase YuxK